LIVVSEPWGVEIVIESLSELISPLSTVVPSVWGTLWWVSSNNISWWRGLSGIPRTTSDSLWRGDGITIDSSSTGVSGAVSPVEWEVALIVTEWMAHIDVTTWVISCSGIPPNNLTYTKLNFAI
jgi:hypothetical protein